MKVRALPLLVLLCLPPAVALSAEIGPPADQGSPTASENTKTDLRKLIREVGSRIHKHFLVDPRAPVAVDLNGLDERDVTYPQLLSLLSIYGFASIEDAGLLKVVPEANVRSWPLPMVPPDNIQTPDDEWVTTTLLVQNLSAMQLVPLLRPLMPQSAQMSAALGRNALIIVDRSANVRRLVTIVKALEAMPAVVSKGPPDSSQGEN